MKRVNDYQINTCSSDTCKIKDSQLKHYIIDPTPKILMLNINWPNSEVSPNDILRVVVSMNNTFYIDQLYSLERPSQHNS
jgi:hypothetical protein